MIRDLSKRPKALRRLDGALTAWRYFHGPNFVHEIRARRRRKAWIYQYDPASIMREECEALMLVLVRFVEWMQAPITGTQHAEANWKYFESRVNAFEAANPYPPRPSGHEVETMREKVRSDCARAMSKGRPGSPFYVPLIGEKPLGHAASVPKFYKAPR